MSKLTDLLSRAQRATEAAAQARQELAQAEYQAEQERQRRGVEAWQRVLDSYDPAQLRAAVVDAEAELRRAVQETELGRALIGYAAAIRREQRQAGLASTAIASGATPPAGVNPARIPENELRDAQGRSLIGQDTFPDFVHSLIGRLAHEHAEQTVAAELDGARGQVKLARESVDSTPPKLYKVLYPTGGSYRDTIGASEVFVVNGEAFIEADHGALNYYRSHPTYQLIPVHGIPAGFADDVHKLRTQLGQPGSTVEPDDPGVPTL